MCLIGGYSGSVSVVGENVWGGQRHERGFREMGGDQGGCHEGVGRVTRDGEMWMWRPTL